MKALIKKILNESDWFDDLSQSVSNLPFEISSTPRNKPKLSNVFKMKTAWDYGDYRLKESFIFYADKPEDFERFVNVCRFYNALFDNNDYSRWQDVSKITKSLGLALGSYDDESSYGTPRDMSDFILGSDFPSYLSEVDIYYFDKGGVEYPVRLKEDY